MIIEKEKMDIYIYIYKVSANTTSWVAKENKIVAIAKPKRV